MIIDIYKTYRLISRYYPVYYKSVHAVPARLGNLVLNQKLITIILYY